ncbi:unnamed protein product [Adineta ricciae]|uniref:Uncharacterized protein n=1 Tax=Adineta ricciae TaxID=249248 RepID=A0A815ZWM1_ADIRI|nr:unnamed protein product [Adineta ricciae]
MTTSKKRWTLMPRKWFGSLANAAHKRDQEKQSQLVSLSSSQSTTPHRSSERNSTNFVIQYKLPGFSTQHDKSATISPVNTIFRQTNSFGSIRQEASIRKYNPLTAPLSICTTQSKLRTKVSHTPDLLVLPRISTPNEFSRSNSSVRKQSNASDQCLLDSQPNSSRRCSKHSLSLTRTYSSSSMGNNDSSSSGIFSDNHIESNEHQLSRSKDTSSNLELLSTESFNESRTSIQPYRLSIVSFESTDRKLSYQTLSQSATVHFHRVQSAERRPKDHVNNRPIITTKPRQSSAAIVKKIEKRIPTQHSPSNTLEKTNFIRITNDTYRLTSNRDNHLYRRQRPNSYIPHSIHDDSLPSANNEDSYAELPRTSSTEQLDKNLQNDLRAIVDSIDHSIITSRATNENPNFILESITDKLLSSMDSSIYTQYERCY